MTKATDLPALFSRLLEIKKLAPFSAHPALAEVNGREISVGDLKCLFFEAWRYNAQGAPDGLSAHVSVYENNRSVFIARCDFGKPETASFTKWKRGAWEQVIATTPPTIPQESETTAQYVERMGRRGVTVRLPGAQPSESVEAYKARTARPAATVETSRLREILNNVGEFGEVRTFTRAALINHDLGAFAAFAVKPGAADVQH